MLDVAPIIFQLLFSEPKALIHQLSPSTAYTYPEMFAKRGAPKGVRKRPNADEEETTGASGAPKATAEGSDEEHACIVKKTKANRPACRHFLVGRVSEVQLYS